jgi:SAM-dependent methyltransferase
MIRIDDEFERQLTKEDYGTEEILQIKKTKDVIGFLKPSLVLDAGCGEGWISLTVQRGGFEVIACDLSKSQLLRAKDLFKKSKEDIPLILSSLTHLPFKQGYYDSVMCLDVIEHVPNMRLALNECHRVLKKGGRLCISVPGLLHGIIYDGLLLKLPLSKFVLREIGLASHEPGHFHVHQLSRNFGSLVENSGFVVIAFYNLAFLGSYITTIKHLLELVDRRFKHFIEAAVYADIRRAHHMPLILGTNWMLISTRP